MAHGVHHGKEQVHSRKILLPFRLGREGGQAPAKVIPDEFGFSAGPSGHSAMPDEGSGLPLLDVVRDSAQHSENDPGRRPRG